MLVLDKPLLESFVLQDSIKSLIAVLALHPWSNCSCNKIFVFNTGIIQLPNCSKNETVHVVSAVV